MIFICWASVVYKEHLLLPHPHPVVLCPELQLFIYRMTNLVALLWIFTFHLIPLGQFTWPDKCFSSVFIWVCDSCTSLGICMMCAGNGGIFSWCVGARRFIWDTMTEILTSILCGWLLICVHVPGWVTNSSLKVYEWCRSDMEFLACVIYLSKLTGW